VLNEILKEYGLSPKKIKRIKSRYPDVKSILDASPQEISQIVDIDVDEAKKLQIFIKKKVSTNKVGSDFLKRWGRVSSDSNLKNSYEEYDRLSKLYPNSPIVWEIKGEILEKMGRFKEAKESYQKAYKLYLQRGEMPPESLVERIRKDKHPAALTKGMGLSNGLGTINGFKNGFKNGLINGKGIINGSSPIPIRSRAGDLGKIIIPLFIVFIIIAAPMLGMIFFEKHYIFKVDGDFQEWESEIPYYGLRSAKKSINILNVKYHSADNGIYFYIHPQMDIFQKPTGIYLFLDTDISQDTGYWIYGFGAEYMIEIYGWNSSIQGKNIYIFNGTNQQDFSNFKNIGSVNVIYENQQIEGFVSLPYKEFRAVTVSYDYIGYESVVPCPLYGKEGVLIIEEKYSSLLEINRDSTILKIKFLGKTDVTSIYFRASGTADISPSYKFSLYIDNGDDLFNPEDVLVSSAHIVRNMVIFPDLNLNLDNSTLFLTANITDERNTENTLELEIYYLNSSHRYFLDNRIEDASYIGRIPSEPHIDGSFTDWQNVSIDDSQDVISSDGKMKIDVPNIDMLHFASYNKDSLYIFMNVRGRILGGSNVPTTRFPSLPDSDGDSVPDILDHYPYDFNNDGIPDNESFVIVNGEKLPDVDGDRKADYPQGNDMWLNTTIPPWFPEPYANKEIHRYIGPVPKKEVYGVDTITIYINADNDPHTGFSLPQYPMGAEYMIQIYGRGGDYLNSSLYKYTYGKWTYNKAIKPSLGYHGMELDSTISSLNPSIFIFISNWKGDKDSSDNPLSTTRNISPININSTLIKEFHINIRSESSSEKLTNLRADFGDDIQITTSSYDEKRPSIARTSDGKLWVVFDNSSGYLNLAISQNNGSLWDIYAFNILADNPIIFSDSQDNVYIFYENHTSISNFTYIRIDPDGYVHPYLYVQTSWWKNVYNLSVAYTPQSKGHIYLTFDYYYNSYYYLGYLHSNDSGLNWNGALIVNLSNTPGNPSITISPSTSKTFIAFEYYYSNSIWIVVIINNTDINHDSWNISQVLYGDTNEGHRDYRHPSIFATEDYIYLACEAQSGFSFFGIWISLDWDIVFFYSQDDGYSWSNQITIASTNDDEISPWVIANDDDVYVFYIEKSSRRKTIIMMVESNDGGDTWNDPLQVDDEDSAEFIYRGVSAIYSGGGIYVVWTDDRNDNADIYFDKIPEFSDFIFVMVPLLILTIIIKKRKYSR